MCRRLPGKNLKPLLGKPLVTWSIEAASLSPSIDSIVLSTDDQKIANKLAYVMAGGDLSEPTLVSEQYLLDIEREAFLSLCTERKTLERIQYMLTKGKPLRN
jgi:CMP-N-acetylneuraminic acid synthetase